MALSKTMIAKLAHIALMGGLALGTQACSKKNFESLNKNDVSGANGNGSSGGSGSGGSGSGGSGGSGSSSGGAGSGTTGGSTSGSTGASTTGGSTIGGSTSGSSSGGSTSGTSSGGSTSGSTSGSSSGGSNSGSSSGGSTTGGTTSGGSTSGSTSGSTTGGHCDPFNPGCVPDGKFCVTEKYQQPDAIITRKLDVLIITDTSTSMDDEREQLANGITSYISKLPAGTDVQFAVSLAHGPTSWYSGRLTKSDFKDPSEKYVISSQDYSNAQIQYWVRRKLLFSQCKTTAGKQTCNYSARSFDASGNLTSTGGRELPQDYDSSGGEAGLYTLHEAIRPYPGEVPRYTSIQNLGVDMPGDRGFFREDAALAVIFISDENDACTVDTDPGAHNDPEGKEAIFRNKYCSGVNAASVLQRLQLVRKSLPLYVSSIIYNDRSKVPAGLENGVGYGYNTIASMAGGAIIDITKNSIASGLSSIGSLASTRLDLRYDFILKYKNVNSTSITAKVDSVLRSHVYSSTTNTVHLTNAGGAKSLVEIYYCLRQKERMEPYNVPISTHLINTSRKTYQPAVTVEDK